MKRWPIKKIGECADVQMGQSPPGETYNSDRIGLPFFQGKAEFGEEYPTAVKWCSQPSRVADAGDILLSVRAPVGPTNFALEKCCIGRGLAAIRAKANSCNQRFLSYYLKRFETDIAAQGVGSTFSAINRADIERLELPVPPLAEQERIAKLLDEADVLRRLGVQADRRTAVFLPAVFDELFGDPGHNPMRWPKRKLRELCEKISDGPFGSNLKSSNYAQEGVRVIRLQNIGVGHLIDEDRAYISLEHFGRLRKHECLPGDVVVGTLGDPNLRACILPPDIPRALNKADCVQIRPHGEIATAEFVCWLLNLPSMRALASGMIFGQTRSRISMGRLAELVVPVPPLPLQKEFARRVTEFRALEAKQIASRVRLDALFQSMLHGAFRGEL